MDIKDLEIFLAIAQEQSIARASKQLYMTPQGISKVVKNLEAERLFAKKEGNVAFSIGRFDESLYEVVPLETFPIKLLVNEKHPLGSRKSVTVGDIKGERGGDIPYGADDPQHVCEAVYRGGGIFIWVLAIALHLALIAYFTVKFIVKLQMPKVFASYYIVYVGIAVAAVLYIFALVKAVSFLKLPFYPSMAAFTFPFVICAVASKQTMACLANMGSPMPALQTVVLAQTVIAVVLVAYTYARFMMAIFGGKK